MTKQQKYFWNLGFNYGIKDENNQQPKKTEEEIQDYFKQFLEGYLNGYETAKGKSWYIVLYKDNYEQQFYNEETKTYVDNKEEATVYKTEDKAREVWKLSNAENDVVSWC